MPGREYHTLGSVIFGLIAKKFYPLLGFLFLVLTPLAAESWNILVYMAADNNLYSNAVLDFNSMESVNLPAGTRVYLQTDFPGDSPYPGGRRWRLEHDTGSQINSTELADLGTVSSGSPETLNDFAHWGLNRYDADRTMLVLWSHGDSWYKGDQSKWICSDDDAETALSVSNGDLKEALGDLPKLDILLFDACSMQTIEVLTEISGVADYVIGSEDLVPDTGFPYDTLLPLFSGSLESILQSIPTVYTASYDAYGSQNPYSIGLQTTCSVVRTGRIPYFINALSRNLSYYLPLAQEFLALRNTCWEMNTGYCEIDLKEFLTKAAEAEFDPSVSLYLSELRDRWNECVVSSSAIMYEHDLGTAVIWFPWDKSQFETSWRMYYNLDFTLWGWLSLLNLAWGEDETPPQAVTAVTTNIVQTTLLLSFTRMKDPDFLEYRIHITGQPEDILFWIPERLDTQIMTLEIPISTAGTYEIISRDHSGNLSEATLGNFDAPNPKQTLIIAPNPVRDRAKARIYWQNSQPGVAGASIGIYDLRGQLVAWKSLGPGDYDPGFTSLSDLDGFAKLAKGLYLVKLQRGKTILRSKLVIQ